MTSPETPRSSPQEAPQNKLLNQFRSTLDKRWAEFDAATLREAGGVDMVRDLHPDFQKAKKSFDDAKKVLANITSDTALKTQLNAPGTLSATIADLQSYFGSLDAKEKQKEYNKVLASTIADLTSLRSQMSGTFDDARRAETARISTDSPIASSLGSNANPLASLEAGIPAIATTVGTLGTAVVGTGLVSEKGWKKVLGEKFNEFKEWILGFFDEDSMLGKLMGGTKEKLAGFFGKIGEMLGIKSAVAGVVETAREVDPAYGLTKGIIKRFFLKKDGNPTAIYDVARFQDMKYEEVKKIYENRKSIALTKAFELPTGIGTTDTDIEEAIGIIVDPSNKKGKHLRGQIDKSLGDAKSGLTMKEVFRKVSNPLSYLHTMGDIGEAISSGNIGALSEKIGMEINQDNAEISGPLKSNMEKISPKVRMGLLLHYHDQQFINPDQAMKFIKSTGKYSAEEDLKEWEKVFEFGQKFQNAVLNNPKIHLGMQPEFQKAFSSPGLSYFGLASLYACTGGETDFEKMSAVEKLGFYGGCASVAGSMDSFEKGRFGMRYLDKLNIDSSEIPAEVKELGTDVLGGALKSTGLGLYEAGKMILGMAVEKPQYALGLIAIGYASGGIRRGFHRWKYH